MLSFEIRSLNLVDPVFPLSKVTQLDDLVLLQSGRQRSPLHNNPGTSVTGRPKPVVAVVVVVPSAEEIDVIRNTDGDEHARFRQIQHGRAFVDDYRRRRANIDVDIYLGKRRGRQGLNHDQAQQHCESIQGYSRYSSSHEVTPFSP